MSFRLSTDQDTLQVEEKRHLHRRTPKMEGYISIREAAKIMGVSTRSVYGYIEHDKLQGVRVGSSVAVSEEAVRQYQLPPVGRPRTRVPKWRVPVPRNPEYLTSMCVRVREGQGERIEQRIAEIRQSQKHAIVGTVDRYIMRDHRDPDLVQIVLVWRNLVMPLEEERQAAIAALCDDLADLLDWETATCHEGPVLLNT